ncbi:MAG: tetratricopeptide repeat protein [Azonexaceae bacterium]|nr:tetratricopeptide repeat protein [Azonexaceae bacterium]
MRIFNGCVGLVGLAKLARFIVALSLLATVNAFAAVIDTVEIARVGDQAEVTIRFTTEIQYTRHTPGDQGKFLRIFFRVTKPGFSESEVMQEVRRSPKSDLIPPFTLAYPELVNGMLITFAKTTQYVVRAGDDSRSVVIMVPITEDKKISSVERKKGASADKAPTPEVVTTPPVASVAADAPATSGPVVAQMPDAEKPLAEPVLSSEKVEEMAHAFLLDGQEAFSQGDFIKAINRMNRILSLPANTRTIEAQALIGEAREKNGEIAKARAEYELYLKLYANSAEASRIRQRLAALPAVDSIRRPAQRISRDEKPAEWTVNGSVSSYFFGGQSKQDDGPMKRDQESLISSVNVSARLRDSVTDTRFVFRDTDSRNFMQPSRNYNRIYSAYAERTDRDIGYFVRVGRQNPNGGGVLERFDGITGSYNLNPDWKVSAVYGEAVEFGSPFKKDFYGASVELAPQVSRPGASLYAIEQNIDGILNRRAVGSEFRYFDGQFTGFGMLDYDLLYKGLNIGMAQANYLDQWGNNYFVSYDYRQSPSYSLTNALSTAGYSTVTDLVSNVGVTQARQLVTDSTALSTMFATGVTIPFGEQWQFGVDYRMSEISGTSALIPLNQMCKELQDLVNPADPLCVDGPRGTLRISEMGICQPDSYDMINKTCHASSEASGRTNMYSAQAIGTNLFVPNAVGVAYVGYIAGPSYTGQNLGLSYIFPFIENWRLESNARYYTQHSDSGQNTTQFSPSMKLVYQWRNSLSLESEIGYSESKNTGTTESKNRREYLYLGIRWDYR